MKHEIINLAIMNATVSGVASACGAQGKTDIPVRIFFSFFLVDP